ncbi:molybdopterin cofactor-binding domain-containing protein [Bradyrhizobium sp. LLZ17]|uniref:Molybdopterin cofactor-binding domain-containing protein n=1 Tax=Bradyrhizobium sp. LLZ17 TaxID=3239388 RepID=A0AB39XRA7_9BRAD
MKDSVILSRRRVLAGAGALVVSFGAAHAIAQEGSTAQDVQSGARVSRPAPLPGSLKDAPLLDSWIRIDGDGGITVFTGKAELGQGIKTALLQVAAEQLSVPLQALKLQTADTALTPNEGFTAGSHSMQDSGTAIMHAAAQSRIILVGEAGRRLGLPPHQLEAKDGFVLAADGRKLSYGELVSEEILHVRAQPSSPLKDPTSFSVMNTPVRRVDITAKVTGVPAYVQDMRPPGMVHARVVRPPSYEAQLVSVDSKAVEKEPGVLKVVRDGDFLAVVAVSEYQAVEAMRLLTAAARWDEKSGLPTLSDLPNAILSLPSQDSEILRQGQPGSSSGGRKLEARYTKPYHAHGSIGPSCAIAEASGDQVTVWTHTQGVFPDRDAIAGMLHLPKENVRCIHAEGSGCYGHNGADDAAGDAALIARAYPNVPVRVQWMREQEHAWEPYGPAMVTHLAASLGDDGTIVEWQHEVWSNTHSMRPGGAGALLAAQHMADRVPAPPPKPLPLPEGGGDRNAIPLYKFPNARVVHHFLPAMPLRVSALRALGAYMNVFSIESFMDELAEAAGTDPVQFRLKYLEDERARGVVSKAAEKFGWSNFKKTAGRGRGFGFARYKNLAAYCAIAAEVEVDQDSGRAKLVKAVAAVDSGQIVNPDGLINQVEGAILQSTSWTLYESVSFDDTRITSIDWATYPIMRFAQVPESIEVHLIDRPGQPFLGAGETGQGPAVGAVANAVAHAIGKRIRELPLSRDRIRQALI